MKKILSLLVFSLFATFSKAQVGIRYVSGVPTAATYTPNISKKESTVVYSTTAFKLYRWDGSGWLEVINSSAGTTYTAGTGISLSNNFITNTGDLSNTNELPIFTTSTTAPIAPKTGDVWNDTSAPSATNIKPTILEKKWNGGTWYTTNAASNSSISYNAGTGVFGISVNGQPSTNTVTITSGGNNIYNTNGSILVGQNRIVTVPESSIAQTALTIKVERTTVANYQPKLEILAADYPQGGLGSNLNLDVGIVLPHSGSKISVLCEPYNNKNVVLREIQLGIPDMPQVSPGGSVSQKRNWINGKEEQIGIFQMTLSNVATPSVGGSKWSSNSFPSATLKAHKVTLFDSQNRYLETFYVETVLSNGQYVINAFAINPGTLTMFNPNQTGAQLSAIIYYTE